MREKMDVNNLKNFFNNNVITGNALIDTIIIVQILPIIITNLNNIIIILKDVILKIFYMICRIIFNILGMKVSGSIVGKISINSKEDYEIYQIFNSIIFNSKVESDIIGRKILEMIKHINSNGVEEIENKLYKKYLYINDNNNYRISVDYSDNDNIFKLNKSCETDRGKIEKIFSYRNHIFRFGKFDNFIEIEITSFIHTKGEDINNILNLLENFLKDRFNFHQNFKYIYHINLPTHFNQYIDNFFEFSDCTNKCLKYSEIEKTDKNMSKFNNQFMELKLHCRLNNNEEINYSDNLELRNLNNFDSNFNDLYDKYCIRKIGASNSSYSGYYYRENKLILITKSVSNYHNNGYILTIIGENKIIEQEIKGIINFILNTSIKNRENNLIANPSNCREVGFHMLINSTFVKNILPRRTFESIYLPKKIKIEIQEEFNQFLKIEKFYSEFEIPYRKGILFYGPPGTGKTSLVKALAFTYQLDIYSINLNDEDINDDNIGNYLMEIGLKPGKKILLFEDIDSAFSSKEVVKNECKREIVKNEYKGKIVENEKKENDGVKEITNTFRNRKKYLTYLGLLNAFDGINSNYRGVIIIMTTNYLEKLGDALIRPGRIDRKFELTYGDEFQIREMTKSFIERRLKLENKFEETRNAKYFDGKYLDVEIEKFVKKIEKMAIKIKPCELQGYMMKNIMNIDDIFDNVEKI